MSAGDKCSSSTTYEIAVFGAHKLEQGHALVKGVKGKIAHPGNAAEMQLGVCGRKFAGGGDGSCFEERLAAGTALRRCEQVLGEFGYRPVQILAQDVHEVEDIYTGEVFEARYKLSKKEEKCLSILKEPHPNVHYFLHELISSDIKVLIRWRPSITLQYFLDRLDPPDVSEVTARDLVKEILKGLLFFEEKQLVFQNLDLSTVILYCSGQALSVKLTGFDHVMSIEDDDQDSLLRLTGHNGELDKYIPPEVVDPDVIDYRKIDPYRLGVLMYRIVLGRFHDERRHPGMHMNEKMWRSQAKKASLSFQKVVRGSMLVSSKNRFSLSDVWYSEWLKTEPPFKKLRLRKP